MNLSARHWSKMVSLSGQDQASADAALFYLTESTFALPALEAQLLSYIQDPDASTQPFKLDSVPKISKDQARQEALREC